MFSPRRPMTQQLSTQMSVISKEKISNGIREMKDVHKWLLQYQRAGHNARVPHFLVNGNKLVITLVGTSWENTQPKIVK